MKKYTLFVLVIFILSSCSTAPITKVSPLKNDGDNLFRLGRTLLMQGRENEAQSSFELAKGYYSRIDDVEGLVNVELATLSILARQNSGANLADRVANLREYIQLFQPELEERLMLGEVEIAFLHNNYTKVVNLTSQIKSSDKQINVQLNTYRLQALEKQGDVANIEANILKNYLSAIERSKKRVTTEAELYSFIAYTLGHYYYNLDEYQNAEKYYLKSLKADKQIDNVTGICKDLYHLGLVKLQQEKMTEAKHYLLRAKEVAELTKDDKQVERVDKKLKEIRDLK